MSSPTSSTQPRGTTVTSTPRPRRRPLAGLLAATAIAAFGLLVLLVVPAWAHIDPDPASVTAGSTATITFGVEHGCGESPTTKLEMRLPAGLTNTRAAIEASGWAATAAGNTVTWSGPAQPPHTQFDIKITATMPTTAGLIRFPIIQTCQQGSLSWIEVQQAGQPEPQYPAPTVDVLAPGQPAPSTTKPADGDAAATSAPTASVTSAPATTAPAKASKESSSNTGFVVGAAIAAVVVIGGAVLTLRRRQAS
jgi:uncharacterized protein YcnI